MKLSQKTIKILKNYSTINNNIIFKEGNQLKTISEHKNIFSMATIEETFEINAGIYDLNSFLSSLSAIVEPELEFGESSVKINGLNGTFEYFYTDEELLTKLPKSFPDKEIIYEFVITEDEIQTLMKTAAITSSRFVSFVCDGDVVYTLVGNRENKSSNNFKNDVGEHDKEFDIMVPVESLKMIPMQYDLQLVKTKTSNQSKSLILINDDEQIQYFIASSPNSKA